MFLTLGEEEEEGRVKDDDDGRFAVPTRVALQDFGITNGVNVLSRCCSLTRNVLTFVNTTAIAYRQNSALLR